MVTWPILMPVYLYLDWFFISEICRLKLTGCISSVSAIRNGMCKKPVFWYADHKIGIKMCSFNHETKHIYEGDTPSPLAYCAYRPILALHTANRHFSASRTAYCLTTITTIFGVSIYMKEMHWQSVAYTVMYNHSCKH